MQFYIIHEDPEKNANLLPDYAIKKVNIREGWQMISDICHIVDISFEGQNKEYNRYHPNTYQFWKSPESFTKFLQHYECCLLEYEKRFNKGTVFTQRFIDNYKTLLTISSKLKKMNRCESMINYMLDRKSKFMTDEEIKRLKENYNA